jgi:hypothetical protein
MEENIRDISSFCSTPSRHKLHALAVDKSFQTPRNMSIGKLQKLVNFAFILERDENGY